MSLNDILLNNRLLCQLYPDTLLEMGAKTAAEEKEKPAAAQNAAALNTTVAVPPAGIQTGATPKTPIVPNAVPAAGEPAAEYGNTPSLGGNKKNILIVVQNELVPYLPDAELEFLSAILSACRLGIADVAIVNLHQYPQPYASLLRQFNSRQVLLLGVTPQAVDLPFHFPYFQLQQFDGCTYLSALPLNVISENRDLKMQLWSCLKNMFGI